MAILEFREHATIVTRRTDDNLLVAWSILACCFDVDRCRWINFAHLVNQYSGINPEDVRVYNFLSTLTSISQLKQSHR